MELESILSDVCVWIPTECRCHDNATKAAEVERHCLGSVNANQSQQLCPGTGSVDYTTVCVLRYLDWNE